MQCRRCAVPLFVADLAFPDGRLHPPVKLGLLLASADLDGLDRLQLDHAG